MTDDRRLRVALLGAGSVGSQVAALLLTHQDELADRAGVALDLVGIAVRDVDAPRDVDLPHELFTTCLLYTSPSPRDRTRSRMPSSA